MAVASRTEFDPVTLEILWSRLISTADESCGSIVPRQALSGAAATISAPIVAAATDQTRGAAGCVFAAASVAFAFRRTEPASASMRPN